ncbi:YdhR family protein [Zavarzinia compransoris]|uniref:YdhR family protein n=1 Tax=Zavarzinia marina TaxID=2911065 RepID=UPI001F46E034|nr:YdhR family protein [Zavarzinia marina]MCF4167090.1 YdhR family protein [Zavarzinia marina]
MRNNPALLTVTYQVAGAPHAFLDRAGEEAGRIASVPGLVWKIWAFEHETGLGSSCYLFADRASARRFADGPALAALRAHPLITHVGCRLGVVQIALSAITRAGPVISLAH